MATKKQRHVIIGATEKIATDRLQKKAKNFPIACPEEKIPKI